MELVPHFEMKLIVDHVYIFAYQHLRLYTVHSFIEDSPDIPVESREDR